MHFGYTSPDGEDGYPGSLTVNVTYSLDGEGGLCIEYKVRVENADGWFSRKNLDTYHSNGNFVLTTGSIFC